MLDGYRKHRILWLVGPLVLWAMVASAADPYLPLNVPIQTWEEFMGWHLYETEKWYEATFSEFENCSVSPVSSPVLGRFPRPSDGLYCYYWSIYAWHHVQAWIVLNAGLVSCEWMNANDRARRLGMTCGTLQGAYGTFTGR